MEIKIQRLTLRNFKGIKHLEIPFGQTTTISGRNRLGKTTIFDAFTWLLFGKDSMDRKDFDIKTIDSKGDVIHRLEHEVIGELKVENAVITLHKVYKEKWTKKQGSPDQTFTGNEVDHYIDGVPMKQMEYQAKIASIINEELFKLITNPLYFNCNLKWQERRSVLFSMAAKIDRTSILDQIATLQNKEQINFITSLLNANKSLVDYKKTVSVRKSKIKEELKQIPSRIDEVDRSKPATFNWDELERVINIKNNLLLELNYEKNSVLQRIKSLNDAKIKRLNDHNANKAKYNQLAFDLTSSKQKEISTLKNQIAELNSKNSLSKSTIESYKFQIDTMFKNIERLKNENDQLRPKLDEINSKEFIMHESEKNCPTCQQQLPNAELENIATQLRDNFNQNKLNEINKINEKGMANKNEIDSLKLKIQDFDQKISNENASILANQHAVSQKETEVTNIDTEVPPTEEMVNLKAIIDSFIPDTDDNNGNDFSDIDQQIKDANDMIMENTKLLNNKQLIENSDLRIKELINLETELSNELANIELNEFTIDQFSKIENDLTIKSINDKFKMVTFKLIDYSINGGETPCCETLVDGVPYSSVNTAGRLNAGLDIINALCNHNQTFAPIFIDNRESINDIQEMNSQIVNLVVSLDDQLIIS